MKINPDLVIYESSNKLYFLFYGSIEDLKTYIENKKELKDYTGTISIQTDEHYENYYIVVNLINGTISNNGFYPSVKYHEKNTTDYLFCVDSELYFGFSNNTFELYKLLKKETLCLEDFIVLSSYEDGSYKWFEILNSEKIMKIPYFPQFVFESKLEQDILIHIFDIISNFNDNQYKKLFKLVNLKIENKNYYFSSEISLIMKFKKIINFLLSKKDSETKILKFIETIKKL